MPDANGMVDLVFRNHTKEKAFGPLFFKKVLSVAARKSGLDKKGRIEVSVTLLGPARMRAMNKRYRGVDAPTDVLSFPLDVPRVSGLAGSGTKRYNEIALGDIFICPSFALKNAGRDGFSPKEAIAWRTVHGFLHLAGYDHPGDGVSGSRSRRSGPALRQDRRQLKRRGEQMLALEKKVLNALAYGSTSHHLRD